MVRISVALSSLYCFNCDIENCGYCQNADIQCPYHTNECNYCKDGDIKHCSFHNDEERCENCMPVEPVILHAHRARLRLELENLERLVKVRESLVLENDMLCPLSTDNVGVTVDPIVGPIGRIVDEIT